MVCKALKSEGTMYDPGIKTGTTDHVGSDPDKGVDRMFSVSGTVLLYIFTFNSTKNKMFLGKNLAIYDT